MACDIRRPLQALRPMIGEPLNDRNCRSDGDSTGHAPIEPGAGARRLTCEGRCRDLPRRSVATCKTQNVSDRIHATNGCMYALSSQYRRVKGPHQPPGMAYIPRWNGPAKNIARQWPERSSAARWPVQPRLPDCPETRFAACCEAMTPVSPEPTRSAARWASVSPSGSRKAAQDVWGMPPFRGSATPFRPEVGVPPPGCERNRFRSATPDSRIFWANSPNTGMSSTLRSAIDSQPGLPPSSSSRRRAESNAEPYRRPRAGRTGNRPPRIATAVATRTTRPRVKPKQPVRAGELFRSCQVCCRSERSQFAVGLTRLGANNGVPKRSRWSRARRRRRLEVQAARSALRPKPSTQTFCWITPFKR